MIALTRKDLSSMTGSQTVPVAQAHRAAARSESAYRGVISKVLTGMRRARARRATLDQLSRLDEAQLRDIGLERGTLAETVEATVEQRRPSYHVEEVRPAGGRLGSLRRGLEGQPSMDRLNDRLLADIGMTREELINRVLDQRVAAANRNRGFFRAA